MERQYIGRYRLLGKLGKGGMGTVLRARDEGLGRDVAIKLPNDTEPDDLRRLKQECDVLMQLQHHQIVQVYGSGSDPDLPFYIVMEYIDGVTVEHLLRQQGGRLEPRLALTIALGVAEALAYAHRPPLRVIHRDIKPSNVLIRSADSLVKVTDFGIAAVLAEHSGRTAVGTLFYMAPEQAAGQGADERSDLYSLGAMLYEMLTGQRPPQFALSPAQPPSLALGSIPSAMSARIDQLVLGLLKADRARRQPQSAAELVTELRAMLEGRPSRSMSSPQIDPTLANAPTRRSPPPLPEAGYRKSRTLPASTPQPASSYAPPPGYQLVPTEPKEQKQRISEKATWAVIMAILALLILVFFVSNSPYSVTLAALVIVPFPAIIAAALGIIAIQEISRSSGMLSGKGMAIASLVLVCPLVVVVPLLLVNLIAQGHGF